MTLILTASVSAATIVSFSPVSVNVTEGQSFNLVVKVDPQSVKNYTVKLALDYPADLLKVNSFTFGTNWMPVSQTGYDSIDNTNGLLIKTAGYPGGLSSQTTFGTISFSAKKAGSGVIQVTNDSLALNATNQNLLTGTAQVSFTTNSIPVTETPSQEPVIQEEPTKPVIKEPVVEQPAEEPGETKEATGETQPEEQIVIKESAFLAALNNVLPFNVNSTWLAILEVITILVVMGYAIYYLVKRLRHQKTN